VPSSPTCHAHGGILKRAPEAGLAVAQSILGPPTRADIAKNDGKYRSASYFRGGYGSLYLKFSAISAKSAKCAKIAHRTRCPSSFTEAAEMFSMRGTEALWYEAVKRLPDGFLAGTSEQPCRRWIK
jgi:hypothetical protein